MEDYYWRVGGRILGIGVYASTVYSKKGLVTVQTGNVVRQDLTSLVTASGEIKPKNYINIGANAQGQIRELLVKEGDRVRKGQLLARIENVQPEADVEAQKATLNSAEADSSASEAGVKAADENIRTMQAMIDKDKSDLERAKAEYDRSQSLYNEHLLAKQDFDLRRVHLRGATVHREAERNAFDPGARPARTDGGATGILAEAHRPVPRRPRAFQRYLAET